MKTVFEATLKFLNSTIFLALEGLNSTKCIMIWSLQVFSTGLLNMGLRLISAKNADFVDLRPNAQGISQKIGLQAVGRYWKPKIDQIMMHSVLKLDQ